MANVSPLRRRMIENMTVRNLSPATQRSYLHAITRFSRFFGRSPDRLSLDDVRTFQMQLVASGISWSGLNQTVCALRFFYGTTLGRTDLPERIAYARKPRKLPVVLSAEEVVRFLEAVANLKHRVALTTAYAAGLRAAEVASLKLADIDSSRMVLRVEQGKGGKDRYVMLSPQPLGILRGYWRLTRPTHWLFPGRDAARPLHPEGLHAACRSACATAKLDKRVTVHAAAQLRHASAGGRHRHPHHPGAARPQQPANDSTLHPGCDHHDLPHAKSARPAAAGARTARLSRHGAPRTGGGGHLPPPRRGVPPGPRGASRPHRTPCHGGDRSVPDAGAGRACRALCRLRAGPLRLQLLPYGQIQ